MTRPSNSNVLNFFTDDQGTLDANCYGSKDLHTPNIDRISKMMASFGSRKANLNGDTVEGSSITTITIFYQISKAGS